MTAHRLDSAIMSACERADHGAPDGHRQQQPRECARGGCTTPIHILSKSIGRSSGFIVIAGTRHTRRIM